MNRFAEHAKNCESLLGNINHLNKLSDDERKSLHLALDENNALLSDNQFSSFANELKFYDEVIRQVLDNQQKFPRPSGP